MSSFGPVSTMAYAAVVTWAFWRFMSINDWSTDFPPLLCFVLCAVAAREFAIMIRDLAMRGNR